MKILEVKTLAIPEVKVIKYTRFPDERGYFTEVFNKKDFLSHPEIKLLNINEFVQCNESSSKKGTFRGLHAQWNPYMGKLVRTLRGHMVDLVADVRIGSPTFGKTIAYDMPVDLSANYGEWIWIPVGFVHGNYYLEDSTIEYFCTGTYNPDCEVGISPFSSDLDWSVCDPKLKSWFDALKKDEIYVSSKDKAGSNITDWQNNPNSNNFIYNK